MRELAVSNRHNYGNRIDFAQTVTVQ